MFCRIQSTILKSYGATDMQSYSFN